MSAEYRIIIIWWISLLPREWIRVIGPRWVSSKLDSLSGPLCWFSPATLLKWIRVHRFRGVSCRIGVGQKLSTHFFSKKNWWINERAEVFTRESGPDCRFCCACGALGGRAAWLGGRRVALDAASRRSWCCRRLQPRHHCRSPPKSAPGADPTVLLASVAAAAAAAAAAAVAAAAAAAGAGAAAGAAAAADVVAVAISAATRSGGPYWLSTSVRGKRSPVKVPKRYGTTSKQLFFFVCHKKKNSKIFKCSIRPRGFFFPAKWLSNGWKIRHFFKLDSSQTAWNWFVQRSEYYFNASTQNIETHWNVKNFCILKTNLWTHRSTCLSMKMIRVSC